MGVRKKSERPKVKKKTVINDPRVQGGKYLADRLVAVGEPQKPNPNFRGSLASQAQDIVQTPLTFGATGAVAVPPPGFVRHVNPSGAAGGLVAEGVTVGSGVHIDEGVTVRRGTLGDGVVLQGDTVVDISGTIGSYSRIKNSNLTGATNLGERVLVEDSNLAGTQVGEGSTLGSVDANKSGIESSTVMGSEVTRSVVKNSGVGSNTILEDSEVVNADVGNVLARKAKIENAFADNCDILYSEVSGDEKNRSIVGGNPAKQRMKIEGNSKIVGSEVFDTEVSSSNVNTTYSMSSKILHAELEQCDLERSVVKGNIFEDVALREKTLVDRYVTLGTSGNALVSPRKQVHPFFDNR